MPRQARRTASHRRSRPGGRGQAGGFRLLSRAWLDQLTGLQRRKVTLKLNPNAAQLASWTRLHLRDTRQLKSSQFCSACGELVPKTLSQRTQCARTAGTSCRATRTAHGRLASTRMQRSKSLFGTRPEQAWRRDPNLDPGNGPSRNPRPTKPSRQRHASSGGRVHPRHLDLGTSMHLRNGEDPLSNGPLRRALNSFVRPHALRDPCVWP